ncbi:MAG: GAF domain-containing protein [Acidimicrobiia bacterium]
MLPFVARQTESQLLEAVLALAGDLSLPAMLRKMVESACQLTSARYGALGVLGTNGRLSDFITVGMGDDSAAVGPLPIGEGILGLLIVQPEPIRLDDLTKHPDSFGFPPGHPPMRSFLGVPISVRRQVFGNLYLCEKEGGGPFSDEDEDAVIALSAAAGVAIENARLAEQRRELDVMHDRERIARDLHDKVIQRLFATGMSLQATQRMGLPQNAVERIEHAIDDLDATIRELRSTIFDLESAGKRRPGLRAGLLELVAETTPALGFEPRLEMQGPLDVVLDPERADHIVTVVREALSNAARHAHAGALTVRATSDGNELFVEIVDDGVGVGARREGGHGLDNMTTRAKMLGGTLEVTKRAEGGTIVELRVPIEGH